MGMHSTKKLLLSTLGFRDVSKEQVEEIAEEMVEKGQLRRKDTRGFIREIMERAQREREELKGALEDVFENLLESIGVVTRGDLTDLNDRIDSVQRSLDKLAARQASGAASAAAKPETGKAKAAKKRAAAPKKPKKKKPSPSRKAASAARAPKAAKKKSAAGKGARTRKT